MKKVFVILLGLVCVGLGGGLLQKTQYAYATNSTEEEAINVVNETLEDIDLSNLENYESDYSELEGFKGKSAKDIVYDLITGEEKIDIQTIFSVVVGGIKNNITSVLKLVILIVTIVAIGAFSENLQSFSKKSSGISNIVNFAVLIILLTILVVVVSDFLTSTTSVLLKLKTVMETILPIILSLLVAVGGVSTSAVIEPMVVVLTGVVIEVVIFLTTSIVTLYLVLSVLSNLTESIKLNKLKEFFASTFKWALGLGFTIFMGYLSIAGITSSTKDKLSIKTAKYAIKSYVPLVGGYVSDSYEIFKIGSVLIKNAVGTLGIIILFSVVVGFVIKIIVYNLGLKLTSGLVEPLGMKRLTSFLGDLATVFKFMFAGVVACFLLCFVAVYLIMSMGSGVV